jgi:hypothetical protein
MHHRMPSTAFHKLTALDLNRGKEVEAMQNNKQIQFQLRQQPFDLKLKEVSYEQSAKEPVDRF